MKASYTIASAAATTSFYTATVLSPLAMLMLDALYCSEEEEEGDPSSSSVPCPPSFRPDCP